MFFIQSDDIYVTASGFWAGVVGGLLGAGGGTVLISMLRRRGNIEEARLFPFSLSVMLAVTVTSLTMKGWHSLPWQTALPYLLGGAAGGFLAGKTAGQIPVLWLHRGLGILMLLGGVRALW